MLNCEGTESNTVLELELEHKNHNEGLSLSQKK